MPVLKNARHEAFAQKLASGADQTSSYMEVFPGSAKWQRRALSAQACKLAKVVSGRVSELQSISASDLIVSRQKMAERLSAIVMTEVDDIGASHVLGAAALLTKLMGYDEPAKTVDVKRYEIDLEVRRRFREVADGD